jgi:hypothetical protein
MFRFGSRSLSGAALCALLSVEGQSHAQSVKLNPATFEIKRKVTRPTGEFPYAINYDDCINSFAENDADRTVIQMRPILSDWDHSQDRLEVWVTASRDCKDKNERTSTGRCRIVAGTLTNATNHLFEIRPADVVGALSAPGDVVEPPPYGPEVCASNLSSNLVFYVMFVAGGDIKGTHATWDKSLVDVAPPTTPANIKVNLGDQTLFPTWDTIPDTDLNGFDVFCEQISCMPGEPPPPDMGTAGAAGAAGSPGMVDASCTSTPGELVPGRRLSPDEAGKLQCGFSGGKAASRATVSEVQGARLENGSCYAVSVASRDTHGNLSALSDVSCGTPKDVITFYEAYGNAGGKGGGSGFCQIGAGEAGSGFAALGGLVALLGKLRRRSTDRRSARHRSTGELRAK